MHYNVFLEEISKRPRSSASKLQSILILHSLNYNFALLQLWSHLLISISKPTEETGLKLAAGREIMQLLHWHFIV